MPVSDHLPTSAYVSEPLESVTTEIMTPEGSELRLLSVLGQILQHME